jgi:hypothetical protein
LVAVESAGSYGEIGTQSAGVRFVDAGAHRHLEASQVPTSNIEAGSAGAHRETEPGVPPYGEGRVRARWYLLP